MKTSQELIEAILTEEKELYEQFNLMKEAFGIDELATQRASSAWYAIESLIDKLEIR